MRTGILFLLATMLLTPIRANDTNKSTSKIGVTNHYNNSVSFMERGVEFHVFLNGDFDFNTHPGDTRYVDYYGRRTRIDRGIRIERDSRGRIRSVGNVFVNYDYSGKVTRIGNIFMKYKRGLLTKVGNLHIKYDRWGNPRYKGFIKPGNRYNDYETCDDDGFNIDIDINIGDIYDYDDVYFFRRDFSNNYRQFREDNNYYYYRALPNAKIGNRSKVLRRKKSKNNNTHYYKGTTPEQTGKSRRNR
ncbi:hypothetical protein ACQY1Q_17050 [Tenacibaculum sp. TC6]|uniref:hypothetical protein n=1 Tax=Tenacibaculum sp. TC6 TaxID=3423223 RepID=UPI003D366FB5